MTGRPIRTTPKGTVRCSVCGERRSIAGAIYRRQPGSTDRKPICKSCQQDGGAASLVVPTKPLSPFPMDAIRQHNERAPGDES